MSPCNCSGTAAFVHLPCLQKWVQYSKTPAQCEICQTSWKITINPLPTTFIFAISILSMTLAALVCSIQEQDLLKTICLLGLLTIQSIIKIVDYRLITMFVFKICFTTTWGIVFAYEKINNDCAWSIAFVDFAHWWLICIIFIMDWANDEV